MRTASFPKPNDYQKVKVGAYDMVEESEMELNTTNDDSENSDEEEYWDE